MSEAAKKQLAFVVYPGLTPLDLIGPLQALSPLDRIDPSYEVAIVAENLDVVWSDSTIGLAPTHTFDDVPSPFAIVVPGGGEPTLEAAGHKPLLDYVSAVAETAEIVMSVCTGALILASAGLLAGRPAITHWAYVDILELLGAKPVHERWVEDGKFITAAGVSAGIDAGLHLAERLVGEDMARLIQRGIEYDPEPPLGPLDWDPAAVDQVRTIFRAPLDDILERFPHLRRDRS